MALKKKVDEKLSTETVPTQSMVTKKKEQLEKAPEALSNDDFLKGLCDTLVSQQSEDGADSKRTKFM